MDTQRKPNIGLIRKITRESFVDLWLEIFGIEAPNKDVEKEVLRRTRKEIKLIRELNKQKEFAPNVLISDVILKMSRILCRFETRVFPMEWELPSDCFQELAPDSPHFSIECFRGEWDVVLKTRCIALRKPKESLIGSHLPSVMDSDTRAIFRSAHRFFTNLIGGVVMSIFECNINWIILDEESEIPRVLCAQNIQQNNPIENTRKRGCVKEGDMKRNAKRRKVEDVGRENIPKKTENTIENDSIDYAETTPEGGRFASDHTSQVTDATQSIRKKISNEPAPISSQKSSNVLAVITISDSDEDPSSGSLMDDAPSSPRSSSSPHNCHDSSDDTIFSGRADDEKDRKEGEGSGTYEDGIVYASSSSSVNSEVTDVDGKIDADYSSSPGAVMEIDHPHSITSYLVPQQTESEADGEIKTVTPSGRSVLKIQIIANSLQPFRIAPKKFVPGQIPSAFEDFYKKKRYPNLKHRPKLLRMSRSHEVAENERFWQPGKATDDNLFGEHLRKIIIANDVRATHIVRDKQSLTVSFNTLNTSDLIRNPDVPVSLAKIETYVRKTMTSRHSMLEFYPDYFPTEWFGFSMRNLGEFKTTNEDIAVPGATSSLYQCVLKEVSNAIQIKKEAHNLCQKMICDLIRTVFVMKLDEDRVPSFYYDGTFDFIP